MATACNWPLWKAFAALPETGGVRSVVVTVGFMAIVASLTFALMAMLIYRVTVKPLIAVMLLSAAVGAHFMGTYNVVLDPSMMANVLQTDAHEARDLMSLRLVASVLVLALL
ncbi:MAG: putative rane protein, partial [Rhizobacter sp.]|nr:putative rane protein [Rhizobacter sp.]